MSFYYLSKIPTYLFHLIFFSFLSTILKKTVQIFQFFESVPNNYYSWASYEFLSLRAPQTFFLFFIIFTYTHTHTDRHTDRQTDTLNPLLTSSKLSLLLELIATGVHPGSRLWSLDVKEDLDCHDSPNNSGTRCAGNSI